MLTTKTVIYVIAIFVAIWFTAVNVSKTIYRNKIPALNFILMAAAYTAVITHIAGVW